MERHVRVLRHTVKNIFKYYFVRLETLLSIVGTLIQYLRNGGTFNLSIQYFVQVLEVLQRIINCHQKKMRAKYFLHLFQLLTIFWSTVSHFGFEPEVWHPWWYITSWWFMSAHVCGERRRIILLANLFLPLLVVRS